MSITASLAFSQLQRSRSRSITTVLAIALSTALTTAVSSFVASGNALLVELWGEDYGQSGSAYFSMLLVPAVILGILIFTMSVIVISNVFRISAGERAEQFGTLKCVGATGKQIMETVMYESVFLSLIGVPCGILLGVILTYFSIGVANQYLEELNSLVRMMMTEITFTVRFVLSWKALLLAAGTLIGISNYKNSVVRIKMIAAVVLLILICTFIQLVSGNHAKEWSFGDYYINSAAACGILPATLSFYKNFIFILILSHSFQHCFQHLWKTFSMLKNMLIYLRQTLLESILKNLKILIFKEYFENFFQHFINISTIVENYVKKV